MSHHRSTQLTVSNDPQNSNFEAGTALENLRAEVVQMEALARAAEAAADKLPAPATQRQRLAFGRVQALATKTSEQASASLRFVNSHRGDGNASDANAGDATAAMPRRRCHRGDGKAAMPRRRRHRGDGKAAMPRWRCHQEHSGREQGRGEHRVHGTSRSENATAGRGPREPMNAQKRARRLTRRPAKAKRPPAAWICRSLHPRRAPAPRGQDAVTRRCCTSPRTHMPYRRPVSPLLMIGLLMLSACPGGRTDRARLAPAAPSERVVLDCPGCPRMRVIPGGSFTIGSPATEPHHRSNEGPQRAVQIAAFAVSELEITRGQYAMFAADTQRGTPQGCQIVSAKHDGTYATDERASWRDAGYPQGDDHPVVCVAWQDAVDYAAWLSRRTGLHYRLLGDAEWEYAARGGATSAYFWGDDRELGCGYANGCDQSLQRVFPSWPGTFASCDDGAVYTAPAGHYRPNAFGLFDMIGNVREWVADCAEPVDGPPGDGAGCALRDVRGGSWDDDPEDLRAARRQHVRPERRSYDLGFRVARDWP